MWFLQHDNKDAVPGTQQDAVSRFTATQGEQEVVLSHKAPHEYIQTNMTALMREALC